MIAVFGDKFFDAGGNGAVEWRPMALPAAP
jgi:hypothetical protein